jgi:hypothetical protein
LENGSYSGILKLGEVGKVKFEEVWAGLGKGNDRCIGYSMTTIKLQLKPID